MCVSVSCNTSLNSSKLIELLPSVSTSADVNICMYVCMYYMNACTHVCVVWRNSLFSLHIHVYIHTHTHISHVFARVCGVEKFTHVCVHVYIHMCTHVCVYVYIHMCTHVRAHTYTRVCGVEKFT